MTDKNQTDKKDGLKIVRNFNASKALVFEAFSTAKALAQWWGPPGVPITVVKLDFKPNGIFHYKSEMQGQTMWGIFTYGNIVKPDLIEFVNSFSDEGGNICKPPFPMEFPYEIFNQLTLTESDGVTTVTLSGYPINASPEQEATYYSMFANMQQGFEGTLNQLEEYLTKIQKQL